MNFWLSGLRLRCPAPLLLIVLAALLAALAFAIAIAISVAVAVGVAVAFTNCWLTVFNRQTVLLLAVGSLLGLCLVYRRVA